MLASLLLSGASEEFEKKKIRKNFFITLCVYLLTLLIVTFFLFCGRVDESNAAVNREHRQGGRWRRNSIETHHVEFFYTPLEHTGERNKFIKKIQNVLIR